MYEDESFARLSKSILFESTGRARIPGVDHVDELSVSYIELLMTYSWQVWRGNIFEGGARSQLNVYIHHIVVFGKLALCDADLPKFYW